MRFLAAGWVGVLENGAWLQHARHANECARQLAARFEKETGWIAAHPVEANAAFIPVPDKVFQGLRERGWVIYNFIGGNAVRFMCSWRTTAADIDALMADVAEVRKNS
jgi:threonine aldolase